MLREVFVLMRYLFEAFQEYSALRSGGPPRPIVRKAAAKYDLCVGR
jgi:hypothetical protein